MLKKIWALLKETFEEWKEDKVSRLAAALSYYTCLLYTSDAADDLLCVDLGGRRIIKKKKNKQ